MKIGQMKTRSGVSFPVVDFEPADVLDWVQDPTKLARVTDVLNMHLQNKTNSVDASADLSDAIEAAGYKRQMETTEVNGEAQEVPTEAHATYGKFIAAAVDAAVTGEFSPDGFSLPSGDDKTKRTAALAWLQKLADTLGDYELDGKKCYLPTLEVKPRKGGTGLLPKWAKDGAANIIRNGSQKAWAKKFTNGYTSASGVAIDPITFDDFNVKVPNDATPEQAQAISDTNIKRLAKCLVEQRRQEEAKRTGEFA